MNKPLRTSSYITLQLVGLSLCLWLKHYDITPLADVMGRSPKWDFTVDIVAALFVATPAIVAYIRKFKGWRCVVGMAILPVVLVFVAMFYFVGKSIFDTYKAKQQRMSQFKNSVKVEEALGIPFPEFKSVYYREIVLDDNYYSHACKLSAEWIQQPANIFFDKLDSLCSVKASWRKSEDVYAFDSIQGVGSFRRLFLSVLIIKGAKNFQIEYDME